MLGFAVQEAAGGNDVAAGLGVGVLASWYLDEELIEWPRAADFEPLPDVRQIVRTVPGEQPDIAAPLIEAIVDEFTDLPSRHEPSNE